MQNQDNTDDNIFAHFTAFLPSPKKEGKRVYTEQYNKERKAHKQLAKEVEKRLTIRPREMHEMYILKLKNESERLKELLRKVQTSKNYVYLKLIKFKDEIESKTNFPFDTVVNTNNLSTLSLIAIEKDFENLDNFKFTWKSLVIANKRFKNISAAIEDNKRRTIPFALWYKVIKSFNEKVVDEMLINAYDFDMGAGLCSLRVRKVVREKLEINNPASFQNHKEIIARGGTPHNPDTAPDGEEWRVYYDSRYKYEWYWRKKSVAIKNKYYYTFQPTAGVAGIIKLLYDYIENNPKQVFKYDF